MSLKQVFITHINWNFGENRGITEHPLPCMHFSITVLVPPPLLSSLVTLLITVLGVLFSQHCFQQTFHFLLAHLSSLLLLLHYPLLHTSPSCWGDIPWTSTWHLLILPRFLCSSQIPDVLWAQLLLLCRSLNLRRGSSYLFTLFLLHYFFFNIIISLFHHQRNLHKAALMFLVFQPLLRLSSLNFPEGSLQRSQDLQKPLPKWWNMYGLYLHR